MKLKITRQEFARLAYNASPASRSILEDAKRIADERKQKIDKVFQAAANKAVPTVAAEQHLDMYNALRRIHNVTGTLTEFTNFAAIAENVATMRREFNELRAKKAEALNAVPTIGGEQAAEMYGALRRIARTVGIFDTDNCLPTASDIANCVETSVRHMQKQAVELSQLKECTPVSPQIMDGENIVNRLRDNNFEGDHSFTLKGKQAVVAYVDWLRNEK